MPAKIKNSVAAKDQVNSKSAANRTAPMPPTEIAQARSLRVCNRSSAGFATPNPRSSKKIHPHSFAKSGRDQARWARRFDARRLAMPSGARNRERRGYEFQVVRAAGAVGSAGDR